MPRKKYATQAAWKVGPHLVFDLHGHITLVLVNFARENNSRSTFSQHAQNIDCLCSERSCENDPPTGSTLGLGHLAWPSLGQALVPTARHAYTKYFWRILHERNGNQLHPCLVLAYPSDAEPTKKALRRHSTYSSGHTPARQNIREARP